MTRVQVLGAGECGLPLALRLLDSGVAVTLVADRDPEAVLAGAVTSTQVKFARTLQLESDAGLGTWRDKAPQIRGIRLTVGVDRTPVSSWAAPLDSPAQSVDQRTVFSHRMTQFAAAGGDLQIRQLSVDELDARTADFDLTVVTRAPKELATAFPDDPDWRYPVGPMRQSAALYLDGVEPDPDQLGMFLALPGLGELISTPALTGAPGSERPCHVLMFAAVPGGPLDLFRGDSTPGERLKLATELLESHCPPALARRFHGVELTDGGGTLVGAVIPAMRRPVGFLPSGTAVLGGGDVVCRMDPSGAQGANSAVHCGFHYAEAILNHSGGPFGSAWMRATGERWLEETAHPAARWTLTMLSAAPELDELMRAGEHDPAVARSFAAGFARPADSPLTAV
ncbi:styrene monooxygenase/indole monooxygenase family protein [Nocardia spumae]|uniref:styrene monooxygenase/indole monooxygenase family protein n=1 Tax=Nocardia spumae TaxID=2887190 RepID=UPI001D1336ED|nr:styrene monooxygenase/indole monooxygenase family protein [Nocardia spumae]